MDPVTAAVVNMFVGGELEVQNGNEGYLYRGKIRTLEFTSQGKSQSGVLRVTLIWNAKTVGRHLGARFVPTNNWKEDTTLKYECATTLPSPDINAPDLPNIVLQRTYRGFLRMVIINPYTDELTVLYPRLGSKLDHSKVRWLPNGPKAEAVAAKNR